MERLEDRGKDGLGRAMSVCVYVCVRFGPRDWGLFKKWLFNGRKPC